MSFISVVVCNNFITVMADSRASEIYTNGDVHRVLDENFIKIKPLNDNVFVVVSGIVEDAQSFMDKSNLNEIILDDGKLRGKEELESWFSDVSKYVVTIQRFRIQFGGLTKDNKLKVFSIDSEAKKLEEIVYEENKLGYSLSRLNNLDVNYIRDTFIELCNNYDGTAESMLRVQGTLNDIMADHNNSVNKNKKHFIIKR